MVSERGTKDLLHGTSPGAGGQILSPSCSGEAPAVGLVLATALEDAREDVGRQDLSLPALYEACGILLGFGIMKPRSAAFQALNGAGEQG